jgi:hypothetical protein
VAIESIGGGLSNSIKVSAYISQFQDDCLNDKSLLLVPGPICILPAPIVFNDDR